MQAVAAAESERKELIYLFLEDCCKTEDQKLVYMKILELSKNGRFIAIQEFDGLDVSHESLCEILSYFEKCGILKDVQHLGESHPSLFRI